MHPYFHVSLSVILCHIYKIGEPDLIEIKAVTFCGTSDASDLTMENVPWHREVVDFANAIANHPGTKGKYGLACVHAHSCCTLLARKDIYYQPSPAAPEAGPVWRTWIDYAKFHELEEKFRTTGETFTSRDYLADTPLWALPGAEEEGFSPAESRVRRNRKGETVAVDYKSTESGCG
jgi:tRNA wybutosine-synthesizing protein 1